MPKAHVNGISMNYRVDGNGVPLMLIMGFGSGQLAWFPQRRFFGRHFQVITFDNRGVGKSDKPAGPYSMRMLADDAVGLLDFLKIERAHILGVSMGGMIAQEIAINYPERVNKLILGCTFANLDREGGLAPELRKALRSGDADLPGEARPASIEKTMGAVIALTVNRPLYRLFMVPASKIFPAFMNKHGLSGQNEAIILHDTLERLHRIKAPTLVIAGTEDRIIDPCSSDTLAARIPNARLVKVENGSHAFMIESGSRFNREVLDFLME